MSITLRLLLGYFLIVGLAAWFVLNVFTEEVKPGVRQSMEDTLVDASQLLAELAVEDFKTGQLEHGRFAQGFRQYQSREPRTTIWGFRKNAINLRVYITDTQGRVIYDSTGQAVGQDYSRWNDVYLTLRGQYGARSTRTDPKDERSSVMYIAAPIKDASTLLGVLTIAKSTASVQPFIDRSRSRIERAGWWLMGGALMIGLLFTWWLTHAIGQLRRYARDIGAGKKVQPPDLSGGELSELSQALAEMREKLDGRDYVEHYVHHLAHEMKSPLTALIGSAELLEENLPPADRIRFTANIREQSKRLKEMLDKLLALATLEKRDQLESPETVNLHQLSETAVADHAARIQQRILVCINQIPVNAVAIGEPFLMRQALVNLLDNAIDFSPAGSTITLSLETDRTMQTLIVRDQGAGIPDYALPRVFERFYSLPRPDTQQKGTGLGLPFVREVALLHGGEISLSNHPDGGVEARWRLPRT